MAQLSSQMKVITEAEDFDVFIQSEITPYFGETTADNIIKRLQHCRREGNNYQLFTPVYQWKTVHGDLQKRQVLKLVSAVYRLKYNQKKNGSNVYSMRSDIKYAKACPECGKIANALYDRLVSEGVM